TKIFRGIDHKNRFALTVMTGIGQKVERTRFAFLTRHIPDVRSRRFELAAYLLQAVWSSFAFDYVARQKISGLHMTYSFVEQLACPTPADFDRPAEWQT